jgi:U3 small nucleolar RNA-associated protein 3
MSDSDIEGQGGDDDDLPDVRAWGQKKRNFYNTDYVDQDYGGKALLKRAAVDILIM